MMTLLVVVPSEGILEMFPIRFKRSGHWPLLSFNGIFRCTNTCEIFMVSRQIPNKNEER